MKRSCKLRDCWDLRRSLWSRRRFNRFTAIHSVDPVRVFLTQSQSLAHRLTIQRLQGNDCVVAIDWKRCFSIMHHRPVVILDVIICYDVSSISVEVAFCPVLNFIPNDFDVFIALGCWLHVKKSNRMKKLMNNGVETKASRFPGERLQIQELSSTNAPDKAPATAVLSLLSFTL